ncbi:unnamed protein product [Caenorhabditis brenneri]
MRISLLLLLSLCIGFVRSWDCGSGKISTFFAFLVSLPASDREYINKCCQVHDNQYDHIEAGNMSISTYQSDFLFRKCLENSDFPYTRTVVTHTYNVAVQINSFFQEKFKAIECIFTKCGF